MGNRRRADPIGIGMAKWSDLTVSVALVLGAVQTFDTAAFPFMYV
jgi:hypothetical protein